MTRFLDATLGEPGLNARLTRTLYSSTASGLLAAFAVGCSSAASISSASTGASAGTSASGARSGAGASAGVAAAGASGASSAGSAGGGASAGSSSSGGSSGGGSDAGNLSDGSDAGSNPDGPDGVAAAPGCAGKTYKLCEDFESGTVGGIPTVGRHAGYAAQRGGIGLANDQGPLGRQVAEERRGEYRSRSCGEEPRRPWRDDHQALGTNFLQGRVSTAKADHRSHPHHVRRAGGNNRKSRCRYRRRHQWHASVAIQYSGRLVLRGLELQLDVRRVVALRRVEHRRGRRELSLLQRQQGGDRARVRGKDQREDVQPCTSIALGTIFYQAPPEPSRRVVR